jgi:hypothetical protein
LRREIRLYQNENSTKESRFRREVTYQGQRQINYLLKRKLRHNIRGKRVQVEPEQLQAGAQKAVQKLRGCRTQLAHV